MTTSITEVPSSFARLAIVVAGLGFFVALIDRSASADTLRVQGSSGFSHELMEPYKNQIEAQAGETLELTASTSAEGVLALLKGKADVAMIWAPLDGVVSRLRQSNADLPYQRLREFRIAKSWIAYPVNPDNPVRSIALANLKRILTGQIDNWRAVGGPDLPIHVVSFRNGSGSRRTTEAVLLGGARMTPRSEILVDTAAAVVEAVAQDRGALGICRESLVRERLPKLRTSVPIEQSLSLVTLGEPTDTMRAVIVATRSVVFGEVP